MLFSITHLVFLGAGAFLATVIAWVIFRQKLTAAEQKGRSTYEIESTCLAEQLKAAEKDKARLHNECVDLEERLNKTQIELNETKQSSAQLQERTKRLFALEQSYQELSNARDGLLREQAAYQTQIAELSTHLDQERSHTQEKLKLLTHARDEMSHQFKTLATEILEEKSKKFIEQNKNNLGELLHPLQDKISDFKTKVEEVYFNEGKDRSALAEQVKLLTQLNNTLSQDTQNLTLALKGDRKAQGNFGELILENLLEKAGL